MNRDEKLAKIRLARSENVGPVTYRHLLRQFASAHDALDALPDLARKGGLQRSIRICPLEKAQTEIKAARDHGAETLVLDEAGYPPLLASIQSPPIVLHTLGNLHLLDKPCLAVVGTRRASAISLSFTASLTQELGENGFTIVSGFAAGVDTAAQIAALPTGSAAVFAGGIDVVYPKENLNLYHRMLAEGLVVSEQPPACAPTAQHFPRRNRIVSGLSLGVIVIEASLRSGSMITARMAGEQGREVFAVPTHPLDPRARGVNKLIRDGATLVESVEDILSALAMFSTPAHEPPPPPEPITFVTTDDQREAILQLLSPTPINIDMLVRTSGVPTPAVLATLVELELAGRITYTPHNEVSLSTPV